MAEQFKQRYNRLDVLVNNAGGLFIQHKESAEPMNWPAADQAAAKQLGQVSAALTGLN